MSQVQQRQCESEFGDILVIFLEAGTSTSPLPCTPLSLRYTPSSTPLRLNSTTMTINHVFIRVTSSRFAAVRNFYTTALQPLGYREMLTVDPNSFVGIGSDYPYIFLKAFPEGDANLPTHIAIDAKSACQPKTAPGD